MIRVFIGRILRAMELFIAQSPMDGERLKALGAEPDKIRVEGSAKYDMTGADGQGVESARQWLAKNGFVAGNIVILGGSTWPGEETALLEIYSRLRKDFAGARLVLVPRHAERRKEIESEIRQAGFSHARRSDAVKGGADKTGGTPPAPDVLLVDTTGELKSFYELASVVFVGKSLCAEGGQNFIEPAILGRAIVVGPHLENFPVISDDFLKAGAMVQATDKAGLERALRDLCADASLRESYGRKAKALVDAKRGSVRRSVEMIRGILSGTS
jgi:3-deoxy-D-manno-octulosonic-acid transferase